MRWILFLSVFLLSVGTVCADPEERKGEGVTEPSWSSQIEGTYKLVMRRLPNGKILGPPDVQGILTYTDRHRKSNVFWREEDGRFSSVSSMAEYSLSEDEYKETNHGFVFSSSGEVVKYDVSPLSGTTPVKRGDDSFIFQLPLHGEPVLEFTDEFMIAHGLYGEDTWVKIASQTEPIDRGDAPPQPRDITGSYQWVGHMRSDGAEAEPPAIQGLLSLTGNERAFNMFWKDRDGIERSVAYIGDYALSNRDFIETSQILVWTRGSTAHVDNTVRTSHSTVRREGNQLGFQPSIDKEPFWTFDGSLLKSDDGESTNIWKKSE